METVINARSETVFLKSAFGGVRRCLVPASGWYEWTGERRRKTAWEISRKSGDIVVFAGIYDTWTAPNGVQIQQAATLTCEPNEDVRKIHHRMGVVLDPSEFHLWLNAPQNEVLDLLQPLPNGILDIKPAKGVDWDAA